MSELQNTDYVLYEYSCFVVKVASSPVLKENAKNLATRVFSSIIKVMDELIELGKVQPNGNEQDQHSNKYIYYGPFGADLNAMENDIARILTFYIPKVEESKVDELINRANILKFDKANILLHEIKQEFEE